jgi:VanZ family protein
VNRFLRYWLPLIGCALFIFTMSGSEHPMDLPDFSHADKFLHAGAYGLLGILFYRAYRSRWPNASGWAMANASLVSAALYGLSDEIHQYFVPGRSADPWDWLADTIGAMLGVIAYHGLLHLQSRRAWPRPD